MKNKTDFTKYFLLPLSLKEKTDLLSKEEKADLFDCILKYAINEEIELNYFNKLSQGVKIIFLYTKELIEKNKETYNRKISDTDGNNIYKKAGIISGIKRSKQYKSLETEEQKEQYLNDTLKNLTNVNNDERTLTEFNDTLKNVKDFNDDVKNVQQGIFMSERNLTKYKYKDKINIKIDDNIDKDKNNLSSSIINQSFKYKKIETLEKFQEWMNWMSQDDNNDYEFENWIRDNQAPDQLVRDKAVAVIEYYQNPNNKTHDFKEALKKFIKNDLMV